MCSVPALLHAEHLIGFDREVPDNLAHVNEKTLVYVAGSVGVLYDTDQHRQRFILELGRNKEIHVLQVSPNHSYLAVAERCLSNSYIGVSIYDLSTMKKHKTLVAGKVQQQLIQHRCTKYTGLSFSHDNKFIIGQATEPDWTLVYWEWETGKVVTTISMAAHDGATPVHQVAFHPHDDVQVSVLGTSGCFVLRLEEGNVFKVAISQHNDGQISYWCHSWVSDTRILIGSENGRVLLVEGSDVQQQFNIFKMADDYTGYSKFDIIPDDEEVEEPPLERNSVTKIVAFTKGFACSCGKDIVYLFERYASGSIYRQAATIQVPNDDNEIRMNESLQLQTNTQMEKRVETSARITALTVSPSEDVLAIATDDRRIYTFTLSTVDINRSTCPTFEPLTPRFHCGCLQDVDICFRKPIIVTCASDRTLAVWNYNSNQQQLFRHLDEDVSSISLHPTGLYVLVGCNTKLRLMGLMIDDIRVVHEFPVRECNSCAFSHGGHLIAASQSNTIMVFSIITYDILATFKGHVGKISGLQWAFDDLKLVSCGTDGTIIEWDMHLAKKINEVTIKGCSLNSIGLSMDNCTSFAVGSDAIVREIAESQVLGEITISGSPSLTSVVVMHTGKALFVGSNHGALVIANIPLNNQDDWQEFQPISTDIIKMKLTHDDKWLFTVSTDGTLGIWKVTDKAGRPFQTQDEMPFLEEILITRADLEDKNLAICELGNQVRELRTQTETQRCAKEVEHQEQIKATIEQFQGKVTALQAELKCLQVEKCQMAQLHEATLRAAKGQEQQIKEKLQSENHQKLVLEYQKYQELQTLSHRQCEELQSQLDRVTTNKESDLQQLSKQHAAELQSTKKEIDKVKEDLVKAKEHHQETVRLLEEDADEEIQGLKALYQQQLCGEQQTSSKIKDEMGILKQKIISLQKEVNEQNEVIQKGNAEQNRLNGVIKQLQKDTQLYKNEIQDRDHHFENKERQIHEIKERNAELNKLRSLLDFKLEEMTSQLEPIAKQLKYTEDRLSESKTEVQLLKQTVTKNEFQISNFKAKHKVLNTSIRCEQEKVQGLETIIKNMKWDLSNTSQVMHDQRKFKQQMVALCKKYHIRDNDD